MTYAQGPDLSRYDGWFDPELATVPIDFAIFKLTEGIYWIDTLVDKIWEGVKKVPIRGGYHYQSSGYSWKLQADHYLSVAARYNLHFHVLDLEEIGNVYSDSMFADTRRIIDYWREKTGQRVVLYINQSTYELFAGAIKRLYADGQTWLDALDIWIAWPSAIATSPLLPKGCKRWTLWQDSWVGKGAEWGTGAATDTNKFNGTPADMLGWINGNAIPEDDTQGEPMKTSVDLFFKVTTTGSVNIRSSGEALGTTNDLGNFQLLNNDIVHAISKNDVNGVVFYAVDTIWRGGVKYPIPFTNMSTRVASPTGEYWCAEKNGTILLLVTTANPDGIVTPPPPAEDAAYVDVRFYNPANGKLYGATNVKLIEIQQ